MCGVMKFFMVSPLRDYLTPDTLVQSQRFSHIFLWIFLHIFILILFPVWNGRSLVHGNENGNHLIELKEVLIIAGNFSLNNELTNLAKYDISTGL